METEDLYKIVIVFLLSTIITLTINPFQSEAMFNSLEFFTSHINDIYEVVSEDLSAGKMDEEEILEVLQTGYTSS